MRELGLNRRCRKGPDYVALVDDEDFRRVIDFGSWHASVRKHGRIYVCHTHRGVMTLLHRFIMGVTDPNLHVDHWNHNGLDNQRANLRVCTPVQNQRNMQKRKTGNPTSQYKGVAFCTTKVIPKGRPWRACICINRKPEPRYNKHIGYFATELEAALAYDADARRYFGEFAHCNFPQVVDSKTQPQNVLSTSEQSPEPR